MDNLKNSHLRYADTSFGPKCNNISLCTIKSREMQNLSIL